ncbi:olfactory receptor 11L1-like [Bombina bombina]|uniref:olfactory receptor 11L1-like n=1 Tax=Bombina bombina TaxID=8345 RepID=UPI00235ABB52|nr:olfactory receptor 11L1-like [Bombina bombina]
MLEENYTRIFDVWIVGLQDLQEIKIILFIFFLAIYLITLNGNFLVILLVSTRNQLHRPMYFLLCGLSLSEITFTTNLIPLFLHIILEEGSTIYLTSCLAQFYVCGSLGATECFLLAMMSYDRYMAICKPLHYASVMTLRFCQELIIWSWAGGFMSMLIILVKVSQLEFCSPNIIDHFFCDFAPIMKLSCSDTSFVEIETFIFSSSVTLLPFIFVIGTYICIIDTIARIPSATGRKKTFSTCSSHLAVVCTFYGTLISVYVAPTGRLPSNFNKILSLIYSVVTPLLNPIIYSLRNREIKAGVQKLLDNVK